MLERKFYTDALEVQNACNLSGVVISFAGVLKKLREEGLATDEIANHPVTRVWADKIASLTGTQENAVNVAEAFDFVQSKSCVAQKHTLAERSWMG